MITPEKLNELARAAAEDSIAHGFRDNEKPLYRTLVKAAVEMAEAVNAYRDNKYAQTSRYESCKLATKKIAPGNIVRDMQISIYNDFCKDTVHDEFADVAIYLLVALGHSGIKLTRDDIEARLTGKERPEKDFIENAGFVLALLTAETIISRTKNENSIKYIVPTAISYLERWMRQDLDESLEYWIEEKMNYNQLRPLLHGRQNDPTL